MNLVEYIEQLPRGGKKVLALKLNVTPSYLSRLVSGDRSITAERALQIESVTEGRVSRFDLRPDLAWNPAVKPKAKLLAESPSTLSANLRPISSLGQSTDGAGALSSSAGGV